jgi:hypothetical protein
MTTFIVPFFNISILGIAVHVDVVEEKERIDREKREGEQQNEIYNKLPADKALQYSVILAEVNRKFLIQNFQPS